MKEKCILALLRGSAVIAVFVAFLPSLRAQQAESQPRPGSSSPAGAIGVSPGGVRADILLRRSVLDATGDVLPQAGVTEKRFRYEETHAQSGKAMAVITLLSSPTLSVRSDTGAVTEMSAPVKVARMEIDDDGSPARLFDQHGRLLKAPSSKEVEELAALARQKAPEHSQVPPAKTARATRPTSKDHTFFSGLGAGPRDIEDRRSSLAARMGPPRGQLNGLDRYTAQTGLTLTEVLVDPTYAVPLEVNVARSGTLLSHQAFTYRSTSSGTLVMQGFRLEEVAPDPSGHRMVTEVEIADDRSSERGAK